MWVGRRDATAARRVRSSWREGTAASYALARGDYGSIFCPAGGAAQPGYDLATGSAH